MTHSESFSAFPEQVVSAVPLSERRGTATRCHEHHPAGTAHGCAIRKCETEATGEGVVCVKHRAALAVALGGGLARLYVELNLALRPGRGGSDEPVVQMSRAKRLPISTEARASQQDMLAVLLECEAALRAAHGWVGVPRRGREGPQLVGSCAVLLDYLPEVLALPGAAGFASKLLGIVGGSRHAAGQSGGHAPNRIDLPCPSCSARSLCRRNGTDLIACTYCGAGLTAQQLDDLLDPPAQREAA